MTQKTTQQLRTDQADLDRGECFICSRRCAVRTRRHCRPGTNGQPTAVGNSVLR